MMTVAAFSQTFRLDVDSKPLNRVLPMLGVEISFDDRALSAYTVSVSESFADPEEALYRLLEGKPFRVEKTGSVYVIVPAEGDGRKDADAALRTDFGKERRVFRGTVIDRSTREPLEYATVSLTDAGGRPVVAGITAGEGRFRIVASSIIPEKIKISYLGYETLSDDIRSSNGELGVFPLEAVAIPLEETVVTADRIRDGINRTVYPVTPQMRDGATCALELLDKIPGIRFDRLSPTGSVNRQDGGILLMVDGMQRPVDYLQHLSPHRIHAVELIRASSGRFLSDDCEVIVHFTLTEDYTGYDLHVSDAASLHLAPEYAGSRPAGNRADAGITLSTRRLNFFATCSHDMENRYLYSSEFLAFDHSEFISLPLDRPNNSYERGGDALTGGVNCRITPVQTVSLQADYASGNLFTRQEYPLRRTYPLQNTDSLLRNTTEIWTKDNVFTTMLLYRGQFAGRLHLYADLSYNYYYNLIKNEYNRDAAAGYLDQNAYNEYKNRIVFNAEAKYILSGNLSIESGYSGSRRSYASGSSRGRGFLDYREIRNRTFLYLSCYPSDRLGFRAGLAAEHLSTQNRNVRNAYTRLLPGLHLHYRISPAASLQAGYAASLYCPSLYQLSPMSIVVDTFLTQIGNPDLRPAVRHHAFAELSLRNGLKIIPQVAFVRDAISEVYEPKEYRLYRTFHNIRTREYSLLASFDRTFGRLLRLKNAVTFYYARAEHDAVRNSTNGWLFTSEASLYHPQKSAGIRLGYYRNMKRDILLQGYRMSDRDYWFLSLQKELWRNRISVTLSCIPPISAGVRYDRTKEVDTSFYREKTTVNLKSDNRMLLLKIDVRFGNGSVKPAKRKITRDVEREKPGAGF
jgi:hypothetical protein